MIFPEEPVKYKMYDHSILDNEVLWTVNSVHDPASFKDNEWYYVFSTDANNGSKSKAGIQIRKSKDLIHWQWVGYAFEGVPEEARQWTDAKGLWAPEVVKYGDIYYLYYAASQFGKNQSFIGVATSFNIEGPWLDKGEVFKTSQGEGPNAIDPNITFDRNGEPWMVYGSFFSGIYISKINPVTGKLEQYGEGKLIAKRHMSVDGAIEGPYIIYNPDFDAYYLFVSYDSLFKDYHIRVARATHIEGPYIDINGNHMTNTVLPPNEVGMKILGGYKFRESDGWIAPGHNSVLKDENNYYIVHHARGEADKRYHYLHVRKIIWTEDGWPLVSPERYAGECEQPITKEDLAGQWEYIIMDKSYNGQMISKPIVISISGTVESNNGKTQWRQTGDSDYELTILDGNKKVINIIKVLPAWDWEKWQPTLVFIGKDSRGTVIVGKKTKD